MVKIAFKVATVFWLVAPCVFLVGRLTGIWNFIGIPDIVIFSVLMFMMMVTAYLNFDK